MEELEQFSKLAIGREKKMIQLKQEINELLGQLDQGESTKLSNEKKQSFYRRIHHDHP